MRLVLNPPHAGRGRRTPGSKRRPGARPCASSACVALSGQEAERGPTCSSADLELAHVVATTGPSPAAEHEQRRGSARLRAAGRSVPLVHRPAGGRGGGSCHVRSRCAHADALAGQALPQSLRSCELFTPVVRDRRRHGRARRPARAPGGPRGRRHDRRDLSERQPRGEVDRGTPAARCREVQTLRLARGRDARILVVPFRARGIGLCVLLCAWSPPPGVRTSTQSPGGCRCVLTSAHRRSLPRRCGGGRHARVGSRCDGRIGR